MLLSVIFATFAVSCSGGGTQTYTNASLGYEISFPASWEVDVLSPSAAAPGSSVQQEYVRLSGPASEGAPSIVIAVNHDARWCETGLGQQVTVVYVDGRPGEQYECSLGHIFACRPAPACKEEVYQIVWSFPAERGRLGYVILGTPGNDVDDVRDVFESLRFID